MLDCNRKCVKKNQNDHNPIECLRFNEPPCEHPAESYNNPIGLILGEIAKEFKQFKKIILKILPLHSSHAFETTTCSRANFPL